MRSTAIILVLCASVALAFAQRPGYCGIDPSNPPTVPVYSTPPAGYHLSLVQVLMRHGDRLPIDQCWKNENVWGCDLDIEERSTNQADAQLPVSRLHRKHYMNNENVFPGRCMAGQLTDLGYRQHIVNGRLLRTNYPGLPASLNSRDFAIRSTDFPRTLQSAQALLRGMYPWTSANNQTTYVDMYTVDSAREWLTPNTRNCPTLAGYEASATASPEFQNYINNVLKPLMQQISVYYGVPLSQMPVPIAVFDCLSAHICHDFPIPGNMPRHLYDQIVAAIEWETKYIYNYPSRVKYGALGMGRLHNEVLSNFRNAVSAQPRQAVPFYLFSAHDTSVMPFLNAIGAWDGIWAPYASVVQMELWNNAHGSSLIRYIYNRKELVLPTCTSPFCDLSTYGALVQPLIVPDLTLACNPNATMTLASESLGVYSNYGWKVPIQ